MTIIVTKPGRHPEAAVISTHCNKCSCEFTFNPPDAIRRSDQREGDYYELPCPTCGATVTQSVNPRGDHWS